MYPHLIHLHGPWDVVGLDGAKIATTPLPATLSLPEGGELRRSFQWISPVRMNEQIFLTLEQATGFPRLILNGDELPTETHPWRPIRVDVTGRLKPRNQLALHYAHPCALAGVRESIHLSIESELAQNVQIKWDWNEPSDHPSFRASMTFESNDLSGSASSADLLLELNKHLIDRVPILMASGVNRVDFEHGPVDVDPWRPSTIGLPIRQEMRVVLRAAEQILWQRSIQPGFRRIEVDSRDDRSAVMAGKYHFPWSNKSVLEMNDLGGGDRAEWLTRTDGRIDLVGKMASHHFYDLADRRGLLVCHHASGDIELQRAIRWRSEHPCIVLLGKRTSG